MQTLVDRFFEQAHKTPDRIFLVQPKMNSDEWIEISYKKAAAEVLAVASYFKKQGLVSGEKVALISKNCAQWILADLSIMSAGLVTVPIFASLSPDAVIKIIEHSESKGIVIGRTDLHLDANKLNWKTGPAVSLPQIGNIGCCSWDEAAKTSKDSEIPLKRGLDELASIFYTSGTTGQMKGVMQSFQSFANAGKTMIADFKIYGYERFFSYLPLAHVAERTLVETLPIYTGGTIYFNDSLKTFTRDISKAQPTIFLAVPRLWAKFREQVLTKFKQRRLKLLLSIPILGSFLAKKIRTKMGLASAKIILTGSAPTPVVLIEWFEKLGVSIRDVYGMTENLAISHVNRPGHRRLGCAGVTWSTVEHKIGKKGEILVKSPCVMLGYYKEPELTKESFEGDYLKTGDIGSIDADGFLKITGRLKEQFKSSKGKFIDPGPIENIIGSYPEIESVCVLGADLPQPLAVVTLSGVATECSQEELKQQLENILSEVNHKLEHHENLAKIIAASENWTIDNGYLTPSMKVKRRMIEEHFGPKIDDIMKDRQKIIFL